MWFNSPGVASTVFTDADGIEPYPVGFGAVEGSVDSGAVGSGTVGRPVGSGAVVGSKGFDRGRSGEPQTWLGPAPMDMSLPRLSFLVPSMLHPELGEMQAAALSTSEGTHLLPCGGQPGDICYIC
jgi:hypothetical protein